MNAFPDLASFAALYPETPGLVAHGLVGHPLLELDALVALAARMRPETVEYNRADLPVGSAPDAAIGNGLSIADTLHGIETNGSWMVLKFIEQDPAYRALLADTLAGLMPVVGPVTGPMLKPEGFIFVSSPHAVTPFHFDPEHNVLLQLRGTKVMTVFPATDEDVVAPGEHERFHAGGHRNLPWREDMVKAGTSFTLSPGVALFVPVKAPHWVANGPGVSISLSVTWRSGWSFAEADARAFNALLRRRGLQPASPARYPARNLPKSLAWRALRKLGLTD